MGNDGRQAERDAEARALLPELRRLDSRAVIDEFVDLVSTPKEDVLEGGIFDHVRIASFPATWETAPSSP